ncbi:MAG TPA: hypothetical protein VN578_02530 [Candidatus Binatia bacterium]|jgi:hypothetical protein|nr:hypothetical protein [Candidatus Binatia bacterium]
MRLRRSGPLWFLIVGIPILVICCLGLAAALTGLRRTEARLRVWHKELTR